MLMGPFVGYGRALVQRPSKRYGMHTKRKNKDCRRRKRRRRKNGR